MKTVLDFETAIPPKLGPAMDPESKDYKDAVKLMGAILATEVTTMGSDVEEVPPLTLGEAIDAWKHPTKATKTIWGTKTHKSAWDSFIPALATHPGAVGGFSGTPGYAVSGSPGLSGYSLSGYEIDAFGNPVKNIASMLRHVMEIPNTVKKLTFGLCEGDIYLVVTLWAEGPDGGMEHAYFMRQGSDKWETESEFISK